MSKTPQYKRDVFGYDYLTCVHLALRLLIGDLELAGVNPEDGTLKVRYFKSKASATVWFEPDK